MLQQLGDRILWQRVADFISRYRPLLLGVTGSTGKTITREAIRLAIADEHPSRFAAHSVRSPRDVATSLLGLDHLSAAASWYRLLTGSFITEITTPEPEAIVVELGVRRPGDIDFVSQRLPFKLVVVTNVGTTHTQYFYSKEMVAHELTSAVITLPRSSVAVLNADDPLVAALATKTKARVIRYGEAPDAHVQIQRTDRLPHGGLVVTVQLEGRTYELSGPHVVARHHVPHLVAAVATAYALGIDVRNAVAGLQGFTPPPGRMRKLAGRRGAVLLDDSYSASPEVVAAALRTLKAFKGGRKIAILGDMVELGRLSQHEHAEVGKLAAKVAQIVIAVGEEMRHAGKEALRAGVDVHHFDSSDEVGKWFTDFMQTGDVVLISGSRAMHMEKVVVRLLADQEKDGDKLVRSA